MDGVVRSTQTWVAGRIETAWKVSRRGAPAPPPRLHKTTLSVTTDHRRSSITAAAKVIAEALTKKGKCSRVGESITTTISGEACFVGALNGIAPLT